MNWKTWAPIAVAVVLGLVAAKVGRDVISRHNHAVAAAPQRTVRAVIAAEDVGAGAALKVTDLSIGQLPEDLVPGNSFGDVNDLVDRVPTVPLVKGQAILETMLAPKGTPNGLTAVVPDGMRAITIEVNEVSGVAGMLMPGCRVDLVMTLPADAGGPMEARTVADDVKILAVGRKFGPQSAQSAAADADQPAARTVTLVVTPDQAHIIELAGHTGNPRFVLRGARDSEPTPSLGVTLAELRGKGQKPMSRWERYVSDFLKPATRPTAEVAATQPAPQVWTVQVIKNTIESTVSVPLKPGDASAQHPGKKPRENSGADVAGTDQGPAVGQKGN